MYASTFVIKSKRETEMKETIVRCLCIITKSTLYACYYTKDISDITVSVIFNSSTR